MAAAFLQNLSLTNKVSDSAASHITGSINIKLQEILPSSQQLVMYLAGSGGTGKSRIITAFQDFARRWRATSTVVICASSGVAAVLIGGCTLHSALGIHIGPNPPDPTTHHISAWSEVGVVIVDEISMVKPDLFDILDKRLQKLKLKPGTNFGGLHMIFVGDLY